MKSWKDVEKYQGLTEREKQDFNKGGGVGGGGEVMADSPLSPPLMRSSRSSEPALSFRTKGQNPVCEWTNRLNCDHAEPSRQLASRGPLNASGSRRRLVPEACR
ncbi:PREDICTED: uncharacterized protein LOC106819987 [Priapulus caudatus]|uniref:Uncharacterized protein LOC106819987 n=1 Tax=Priapulus caudatus TaxID=37621 RepID=A0ABM1F6G5_PRICU|nr:PREDICTED: uncharacterized protein LOC106819987 [Priapulus caudatus]